MAKSKSFFGLRKGSTKTLTFQVVNGAQVTKDRVAFVKNPRTESQMASRCLMATASAAYRAMREIVDHSFEGYTYGQKNMSQFIAQNITLLRNNAAIGATEFGYNKYRDRAFHPGAYKISKGSLTPTLYQYNMDCDSYLFIENIGSGVLSDDYTVDDIANALGLAVGEMTTVCFIYGDDSHGYKFGFVRIKRIGMGNVPVTTQQDFDAGFQISSNLGAVTFVHGIRFFTLELRDTMTLDGTSIYSGVIYSRHTAQGWLRSTAYISIPDGTEITPDFDTALATYPQGTNYVLNGGIIGNGGRKSPSPKPSIDDLVGIYISGLGNFQNVAEVIAGSAVGTIVPIIINNLYITIEKQSSEELFVDAINCDNVGGQACMGVTMQYDEGLNQEEITSVNCELVSQATYQGIVEDIDSSLNDYVVNGGESYNGHYAGLPIGYIDL